MHPDDVATAARRLAAKMTADQAVPLMISFVGLQGDPRALGNPGGVNAENATLVLVARGEGLRRVLAWIEQTTGPKPYSIEIENPKRAGEAP